MSLTDRPWWPQVRAAFVTFHLLAVGIASVPAPEGGMIRSAWSDPSVVTEFRSWTRRLNNMGIAITQAELEDRLWDFGTQYMSARKVVLAPFTPYYRAAGTRQSWRMFVSAQHHPSRLFIELQEGSEWRLIYEQNTPGATWMKGFLEHDRVRSATFRYSWKPYAGAYKNFGRWLAEVAAEDFPEAVAMRTRWYRAQTPSPEQVLSGDIPEGTFHSQQVYPLAPIRADWEAE